MELAMNSLPPDHAAAAPIKAKWRWYNFSLKTLLVVMTALAIWLGLYAKSYRDRRTAVAEIERLDGAMGIKYLGPEWLRKVVNDEKYFWDPAGVHFNRPLTVAELESVLPYLMSFQRLHDLTLRGTSDETLPLLLPLASKLTFLNFSDSSISDASIANLKQFPKLQTLIVLNTRLTTAGRAELQRAFPKCSIVNTVAARSVKAP